MALKVIVVVGYVDRHTWHPNELNSIIGGV